MFYEAPTYLIDEKRWTLTPFETRKDVVVYIDAYVKYPGEYNLKYANGYWNEQGLYFEKNRSYPKFMHKSSDFKKHWDFEKEKCRLDGFVIYKSESENLEYLVPGMMYFYLNYCPIVNKLAQKITLPEIYDGDLHYFLYILRCIYHRKYGVVLKKRQAGYTLKNMSILLNSIWFGNAAISKIFAHDITKVEDSWSLMENYRDHINKYAGWKRGFEPSKKLDWQIRRKKNDNTYVGNMSILKGFTTQQKATNGVGGNAAVIFGEEAGMNPTLDITHEYITSNVALGGLTTGLIIYSGAVGELDKAEPLKNFILNPSKNGFLPCENRIEEDIEEFGKEVGFFAPEWWNYVSVNEDDGSEVKCYDEDGNTNKELALQEIEKQRKFAIQKKASSYRYYCSQRPLSIKETFAYRKDSFFPSEIISDQENRIEIEKPKLVYVDLIEKPDGTITHTTDIKCNPILKFPVEDNTDLRGCVVIKEFPEENSGPLTYFAGVDPIATDKTTTSESLFSVYIFKNVKETLYTDKEDKQIKKKVSGFEAVAWYTGRMEDLKKTNTIGEYLIRYYKAKAVVESNVQSFINHMQTKNLQMYLATKGEITFLGDLNANKDVHKQYGVHMTPTIKSYILNNIKEYVSEENDVIYYNDGKIKRTVYGVERISDPGLLSEMKKWHDKLNTDRIIAFGLALSMAKSYIMNGVILRENQVKIENQEVYKPNRSFFKTLDRELQHTNTNKKSYFKYHG